MGGRGGGRGDIRDVHMVDMNRRDAERLAVW